MYQQVKQNNSNLLHFCCNNQFSKRTVILRAEFILLSNPTQHHHTSSTFWSKDTSVRIRLSQNSMAKQIPLNDLFQLCKTTRLLDEEAGKALAAKKALQASKGGKNNVKSVTDEILGELTSAQKKNYVLSWLYGLKKRWMHMHRQSRKRPHEMIESDVITSQATGPTHRILKNKEPGLFTLWVSIGSELHNVRLRAPRIFC
ncbi:hypothetical protein T07_3261, partial [Trichinella nelsoni]